MRMEIKISSRGLGAIAPKGTLALTAALATMAVAGASWAQLPMPATSQFDVTGVIQSATLDSTCAASPHCGGTITINGQVIVVPKELIAIFPAQQLTWQEVFTQAPAPYGVAAATPSTGLAMNDLPVPLTQYEAEVIGNRVIGGPAGADLYIAAMINISQNALNMGQGFINFIDYTTGEFRVGGTLGVANGARVRLNDSVGRYGRVMSPDLRFASDPDNATVTAATGFPMCFPRSNPAVLDDALCPQGQRPLAVGGFSSLINTNNPTLPQFVGVMPDPKRQAPFEVGDWVSYAGTLVTDAATPTTGPYPANGAAGTYISAHTITNNVAIYTSPGTNPAYVRIDVSLLGTGGLIQAGVGEAVARTRFEGMTTDTGRNIHLYALDVNAISGAVTDRDMGQIGVDQQPPVGANGGRWKFRPPCSPAGVPAGGNKGGVAATPPPGISACLMNATGTFLPPPREVRAVLQAINAGVSAWVPGQVATTANGLIAGQYHAPIQLYIFQENVPGAPVVNNNFNTIPFLAQGGYTSSFGTLVGQLNPWPDLNVPATACTAPTANAGGPYTVASGGTVSLSGSVSGTAPFLKFAWNVDSGSLSSAANANPANPVFSALAAVSPVTATLTVQNACGSATSSTSILVDAAGAPTVSPVSPITVFSANPFSFGVSATDPNGQAVVFTVTQTGAPALLNLTVTQNPANSATISFTAPSLVLGTVTPATITLQVTATNAGGTPSDAGIVTVTVKPLPDALALNAPLDYRTGLQRLIVSATPSIDNPAIIIKLNPYLTSTGVIFDPTALGNQFTYAPGPGGGAGGVYLLTLVGAPQPALGIPSPVSVSDNLGATSPPSNFAVTIRP